MGNFQNKTLILAVIIFCLFLADFFIGDRQTFLLINKSLSNPVLDFFFLRIFVPLFLLLGIIPALMILFKNWRLAGIFSLALGFFLYLGGTLIKFSPRPADILSGINLVGDWGAGGPSFPSTTTMLAFGLALPMFFLRPKIGFPLLVLAFFAGFFTVYSGYHFPKDAITGAALSLAAVFLIFKIKNLWHTLR